MQSEEKEREGGRVGVGGGRAGVAEWVWEGEEQVWQSGCGRGVWEEWVWEGEERVGKSGCGRGVWEEWV